jgi:hypothetical protein
MIFDLMAIHGGSAVVIGWDVNWTIAPISWIKMTQLRDGLCDGLKTAFSGILLLRLKCEM